MDLTYSLDELARTSDDIAVRRRFAQRNLMWSWFLLVFFAGLSLAVLGVSLGHRGTADKLVAAASVVLVAGAIVARRRARAWVEAHSSAAIITLVALQYALVLTFFRESVNWIPWVMLFPYLMLPLRMAAAELGLLHGLLAAGALAMPLLNPVPHDDVVGVTVAAIANNALALILELVTSYRLKKEVTRDWSTRRDHAREQIRMRDELNYARELQLSMLPECAPSLPWADICSISVPATEVGGDYYDYFVDDERIALVCGDVAGHGMASGLVLSALRSGFTLLRDSLVNPSVVLQRLHDLVAQTSRRRMLVTVTVVLLDHAAKRATIASAGHPPVVLRRADGSVETIDLYAPPLGVRLPLVIQQRQIDFARGDVFILHSDGIYEARNAHDEVYGLERLMDVVREHGHEDAESLRNAIVGDVERFRGTAMQGDDVTVVVARLT